MNAPEIRLLALDVDGVLTGGALYYGPDGEELKTFHVHDGLGLKLLEKLGVTLAVLSGRGCPALERRLDELQIRHRILKCSRKDEALEALCESLGIALSETAFMGDDLNDLGVLRLAGYALAPANAVPEVRAAADYVTAAAGGNGAVREACEHLARLRGASLAEAAQRMAEFSSQ